jgi:transposase
VSADAAEWISTVVKRRCPDAVQCADAFHVVAWATDALDQVRRDAWNTARGATSQRIGPRRATGHAKALKHSRYALWKNPEHLTDRQREKLAWIAKTDPRLHRAYLLKEGLRLVFVLKGDAGKEALDHWISWARRCRIEPFVKLQRRIVRNRAAIDAALDTGLSNALIESTNTKIRLITRIAFGFKSADALIALALLSLGGYTPALPGRTRPTDR